MLQNVHRVEGDVAYISLSRGQEAIIDAEDLQAVLTFRWYAEYSPNTKTYYARSRRGGESSLMHRVVMHAPHDMWVDHINHDTLDNRKSNLRLATPAENAWNWRPRQGTKTGTKNVTLMKRPNGRYSYFVSVTRNGVTKNAAFPYSPDGLLKAKALAETWQADITYEPPRKRRVHPRHAVLTPKQRQERPDVRRVAPVILPRGEHWVEGDAAYVSLGDGIEAIVDLPDLQRVLNVRWHATRNVMGSYYAARREGRTTTYMHRWLLDAPKGSYVDHINHDTIDNRRANLRIVSNVENNANRAGAYRNSRTGIRGVSIHRYSNGKECYVFRCHCVTCKVAKYFPHSNDGYEEARAFAETHYATMKQPTD